MASRSKGKKGESRSFLRRLDDARREMRFESGASPQQYLAVILMSAGAIAIGAGVYAVAFRTNSPPDSNLGPILMTAGALGLVAYALLGGPAAPAVRVGDFGVGFEKGEEGIDRVGWYQIKALDVTAGALRLRTAGPARLLALRTHGPAARLILAEAEARIPDRVECEESELKSASSSPEGREVDAEPPQVTDLACAATTQALGVERDVRVCGRCGVFYHRNGVPDVCVACGAPLKRKKRVNIAG